MIIAPPGNGFLESGDWTRTIVFLNGIRQDFCVYADDVTGKVINLAMTDVRQVLYDVFGQVAFKTFHGNVTLIGWRNDDKRNSRGRHEKQFQEG